MQHNCFLLLAQEEARDGNNGETQDTTSKWKHEEIRNMYIGHYENGRGKNAISFRWLSKWNISLTWVHCGYKLQHPMSSTHVVQLWGLSREGHGKGLSAFCCKTVVLPTSRGAHYCHRLPPKPQNIAIVTIKGHWYRSHLKKYRSGRLHSNTVTMI